MKKNVVLSAVVSVAIGCGGAVSGSQSDAAVDSATTRFDTSIGDPPDSSVPFDSARDTRPTPIDTEPLPVDTMPRDTHTDPPLTCDRLPIDPSFVCDAPSAAQKGGPPTTACSESALQAFATACIAADYKVGAGCDPWKTANAACAACIGNWALAAAVIPGKVYPDRDKCWYQLLDGSCSTSINCMFACDDAICTDCDRTAGSSADGRTSEYQDCVNRERRKGGTTTPRGACYDRATGNALKCLSDNADLISPCFISELFTPTGAGGHPDVTAMQRETVIFYRGACRDGGDWSKSATP